jgi:hypothetical protein
LTSERALYISTTRRPRQSRTDWATQGEQSGQEKVEEGEEAAKHQVNDRNKTPVRSSVAVKGMVTACGAISQRRGNRVATKKSKSARKDLKKAKKLEATKTLWRQTG